MDAVRETGYPAIARAQQLSAERLGVRESEHQGSRWDIPRPMLQHSGDGAGDVRAEHAEAGRSKLKHFTVENVATAMRSSLSPPPATARRSVGDFVRRDTSLSPLPPRHSRPAQRTAVLVDITQILRSVRGEAVALDRFLSLEVEPAAQQILEAAASEHAEACRLLAGPPAASFGIDPVSSNSSTPTTAANTNDDEDDDDDSRGFVPAAASATTSPARAPPPAPSSADSVLSEARRRAIQAQVIRLHPPPEFSLRLSLPARGSAGAGAGGTFGRRPSTGLVGRGAAAAAAAGGRDDDSRWSLPGRHYRTSDAAVGNPGGISREGGGGEAGVARKALMPRGAGRTPTVATAAGDGRDGESAGPGGRREAGEDDAPGEGCVDDEEEGEEEDDDDDDGEWELRRPDGQLASDISSKMKGLSSLIRSKAAAESGRNDDCRRHHELLGR
eukprot:g15044.t1